MLIAIGRGPDLDRDAVTKCLPDVLALKHGAAKLSWGPLLRRRFGYATPDEMYEAVLFHLVTPGTAWLDVGCGRDIFPSNRAAARTLAERCARLVGIDPSDNIDDNTLVSERFKGLPADYPAGRVFDLVTMRMVVEHVTEPDAFVAALARLTAPGGRVVLYTVNKWAPSAIAAAATPMFIHHAAKRVLWGAQERDTFPTAYRMNTRRTLSSLFRAHGFTEELFMNLADCRATLRWRLANTAELSLWRLLRGLGLDYPESCILAAYTLPN